MALAKGKESKKELEIKKYIGVAPVYVLAVNPNKEKLEELYGRTLDKEPEYVTEKDGVKSARIDFIVKTNPERCGGIELVTKVSFFLADSFIFGKENTKTKIIDKYGRTAWVTKEELKEHAIPQYSTGPANIDKDYRQCYKGEEELTDFMKVYLEIPNVQVFNRTTNSWHMAADPSQSEARLDNIADYFKGNFKELVDGVNMQPNNQVKVLFGIKNTEDGKQFQDVFTQKVLRSNATNYSYLENALEERKENGGYSNTIFEICTFKEYGIEPTTFGTEDPSKDEMPW